MISKIFMPFLMELLLGLIKGHPYDENREKRNKHPIFSIIIIVLLASLAQLGDFTFNMYNERGKLEIKLKQVGLEHAKKEEISKVQMDALKAEADRLKADNQKLKESLEECGNKKSAANTLNAALEKKLTSCSTARGGIDLDDINKRLKGGKNL